MASGVQSASLSSLAFNQDAVAPRTLRVLATLKLNQDDKVKIDIQGDFYLLDKESVTFFEGRLITKIDE